MRREKRKLLDVMFKRALQIATSLVAAASLALGWYVLSPRWAISKLSDWQTDPENLSEHYDRQEVRAACARQMLPQVDDYPPPLTKDVVLDALSHPRAVRMFVAEPYGEWQFAAAAGLPPRLASSDPTGVMPRIMETTDNWEFHRSGVSRFVASPSDRAGTEGNRYHFERHGLHWRLVAIELTTKIR